MEKPSRGIVPLSRLNLYKYDCYPSPGSNTQHTTGARMSDLAQIPAAAVQREYCRRKNVCMSTV